MLPLLLLALLSQATAECCVSQFPRKESALALHTIVNAHASGQGSRVYRGADRHAWLEEGKHYELPNGGRARFYTASAREERGFRVDWKVLHYFPIYLHNGFVAGKPSPSALLAYAVVDCPVGERQKGLTCVAYEKEVEEALRSLSASTRDVTAAGREYSLDRKEHTCEYTLNNMDPLYNNEFSSVFFSCPSACCGLGCSAESTPVAARRIAKNIVDTMARNLVLFLLIAAAVLVTVGYFFVRATLSYKQARPATYLIVKTKDDGTPALVKAKLSVSKSSNVIIHDMQQLPEDHAAYGTLNRLKQKKIVQQPSFDSKGSQDTVNYSLTSNRSRSETNGREFEL